MITFAELTRALDSTGVPFRPFDWDGGTPDAPAWGAVLIGASNPIYGDDGISEEYLSGTISLCSRVLDSTAFNAVGAALARLMEADAVFTYRFTGVREDTGRQVLFYSWRWSGAALDRFE